MNNRSRLFLVLLALVLIATGGCVHESDSGSTHVVKYEWWLPLSVFLGGAIAGPAGWLLRRSSERFGWGLLILGPLAAIGLAPSLFMESATLDDNTYKVRSGFWGMTASQDIELSKLKTVTITTEERRGRRGRKTKSNYLVCEFQDGTTTKLSANNDVTRAAASHFVDKISARGITVNDQQW